MMVSLQIKQYQQTFKLTGYGLKREQQMEYNINYLIHQDYILLLIMFLVGSIYSDSTVDKVMILMLYHKVEMT